MAAIESEVRQGSSVGLDNSLSQKDHNASTNGYGKPLRKKARWAPQAYQEQPGPPSLAHRAEEEAAAQAVAQAMGYEGRRGRRFMQRRTVDYAGSIPKWALRRATRPCVRAEPWMRPSPHQIVDLLPPAAYKDSSTSVGTALVHTSTNKVRCPVNVVKWTPEGRRLLTGSTSGEFTLWNGLTFNFETILQAHDSAVRSFEWSKSGTWLISSDQNGQIKYFQQNMNNLQAFEGHREAVRGLSFSPDDARFVSASDDSTMKIWGFEEAREEKTMTGHGWDVKCVDWHPTKGLIVSGSKDNLVKFWDPRSSTVLATFHGHKNTVQDCSWSPDGNLVATASRDQVVKLYDIRAMKDVYTLKGHKKEVCSVTWHPVHHDLLVSGGSEGSILYWSLRSEDPNLPVHMIEDAHDSNVWSLAWHPLGHILCSGSNDHTTRFWSRARPGDEGEGEADEKARDRFKNAARGTDWDNDDFIPGLTSNQQDYGRSFIPPTLPTQMRSSMMDSMPTGSPGAGMIFGGSNPPQPLGYGPPPGNGPPGNYPPGAMNGISQSWAAPRDMDDGGAIPGFTYGNGPDTRAATYGAPAVRGGRAGAPFPHQGELPPSSDPTPRWGGPRPANGGNQPPRRWGGGNY